MKKRIVLLSLFSLPLYFVFGDRTLIRGFIVAIFLMFASIETLNGFKRGF